VGSENLIRPQILNLEQLAAELLPLFFMLWPSPTPREQQFATHRLTGTGMKVKGLATLPLATLEGEGSFRIELAAIPGKQELQHNIEIQCASFPMVARAVATGSVAGILPSVAAVDLGRAGTQAVRIGTRDGLKREVWLAGNSRVLRIRTALVKVRQVFSQIFRL
jgi:DNA-binding transcriptional LysR family regulator